MAIHKKLGLPFKKKKTLFSANQNIGTISKNSDNFFNQMVHSLIWEWPKFKNLELWQACLKENKHKTSVVFFFNFLWFFFLNFYSTKTQLGCFFCNKISLLSCKQLRTDITLYASCIFSLSHFHTLSKLETVNTSRGTCQNLFYYLDLF